MILFFLELILQAFRLGLWKDRSRLSAWFVLEEYSAKDSRVKVLTLEKNLGIAGNTQQGIDAAKGGPR